MIYYAHSPSDGIKAQTYAEHVCNVSTLADKFAKEAGSYSKCDGALLSQYANEAAEYHDLGKLDERNQQVLSGKVFADKLPICHPDAGAAHWLNAEPCSYPAAVAIQAHHVGFPDFIDEGLRGERMWRDKDTKIANEVDRKLSSYEEAHKGLISHSLSTHIDENISGDLSIFMRMLLSSIVDADHTDTARHYGKYPKDEEALSLRASERLDRLNAYVESLQKNGSDTERNRLRSEMYYSCRDFEITDGISFCESAVGSGKTTAVMAHLLAEAQKRSLRRIFVVLPFTNIIQQSVKKYREILTLPGENPNEVVAELHHRADFESEELRYLTALWRAPIIVTTAVAFFETIASNSPASMRRLHELPGSAIFVDESHAALPVTLLPIAFRWMKKLADEWSCYWVLASGSTNRFWEIDEIVGNERYNVPEITDEKIRKKLSAYEHNRITYRYDKEPKSTEALADWIMSFEGSRLVIMNTIQSAAVLADFLSKKYGREKVEHLSTALTPLDREATLSRIKARLCDKANRDFTLVATSCVEAGIDISFKVGFRELSSLSSLLQAAGRINRDGDYINAEMWTFRTLNDGMLKPNPSLENASKILKGYFDSGKTISPQLVTESISDEIKLYDMEDKHNEHNKHNKHNKHNHKMLIQNEEVQNFKSVEKNFKVIDEATCLVVIDNVLADKIKNGGTNWKELQKNSVHIPQCKLQALNIPCIKGDIYHWNLLYNDFLGYMAGIVERIQLKWT